MSDNKFIERLKGESTRKSVLEVKNEATKTSFANMPSGSSNAFRVYDDARGDATAVLKGTEIWKLQNNQLVAVNNAYGDGRDFTSTYTASGNTTWVNAVYTLDRKMLFTGATKWVLKLCGHSLLSESADTVDFTLLIKFNNSPIITKAFTVKESAFEFCKEFIIDFNESEQTAIKMDDTDTITVQLLCADATASATIYNGMTTLVALQRRVDGETVASDLHTFEDLEVEVADIQDDIDQIHDDIDDLKDYCDETFLPLAGGTLTGDLAFQYNANNPKLRITQSGQNTNHLRFINNTYASQSVSFDLSQAAIHPLVTGRGHVGTSDIHFGDAHIDKIYTPIINNGYDISVPVTASAQTLALKSEVDLAANSGRMITDQGVWYAKMYSATVAPSAEDGTNYADFSQTDGQGNPIIVIYNRVNGAWVQDQTITPPAEYDGYVPITSKIWDITEQAGQQGGRILWNHQSKEFTPYPQIISFEDIEITGNSTVVMPVNPTGTSIVNKDYVDNKVSSSIGNGTITLTQSGNTMGTFTTNQSGDTTIALDGGSSYHPDLFDWKWADHELDDMQWLRADTFSWQSGAVYEAAYQHLVDDKNDTVTRFVQNVDFSGDSKTYYRSTQFDVSGASKPYAYTSYFDSDIITVYTSDSTITYDSTFYTDSTGSTSAGTMSSHGSGGEKVPTVETVNGVKIAYYTADDGHKIVLANQESNVAAIYASTGVAWYYILDSANQRFKLPRSSHNKYTTELGVVGTGKVLALTTGTNSGSLMSDANQSYNPVMSNSTNVNVGSSVSSTGWTAGKAIGVVTDAATSGLKTTSMEQDTDQYKYLYFYVGQFTQTALENTAGLNAELFNDKVDIGHQVIAFQAPTAGNNYTWYRKYADGWVEQGGITTSSASGASLITLPVEMSSTNYNTSITGAQLGNFFVFCAPYSVTQIQIRVTGGTDAQPRATSVSWEVKGIVA